MKLLSRFRSRPEEPAQDIPAARLKRLNQLPKRRLSDAIMEVFNRACVQNDLRTAAGLLGVLSDLHDRRAKMFGTEENPLEDTSLVQARAELDRCREMNRRKQAEESGR